MFSGSSFTLYSRYFPFWGPISMTGKSPPGVLQFMGSQSRTWRSDLTTERAARTPACSSLWASCAGWEAAGKAAGARIPCAKQQPRPHLRPDFFPGLSAFPGSTVPPTSGSSPFPASDQFPTAGGGRSHWGKLRGPSPTPLLSSASVPVPLVLEPDILIGSNFPLSVLHTPVTLPSPFLSPAYKHHLTSSVFKKQYPSQPHFPPKRCPISPSLK